MFKLQKESIDFSKLKETLVSVLRSINEPAVSAGEYSPEPAQAFVLTYKDKKKYSAKVVLHLVHSVKNVIYGWGDGAFDPSRKSEVEDSALDFLEKMGFMMDNLQLAKKNNEEKANILDDIPFFKTDDSPIFDANIMGDLEDQMVTNALPKEPFSSETVLKLDSLMSEEMTKDPVPMNAGVELEPEYLDSEYQRKEEVLSEELDSVFEGIENPTPTKAKDEKTKSIGKDKLRALIRLMSSF